MLKHVIAISAFWHRVIKVGVRVYATLTGKFGSSVAFELTLICVAVVDVRVGVSSGVDIEVDVAVEVVSSLHLL